MSYLDASQKTLGTGNRYRAIENTEFSYDEAIHWVGGNLPKLEKIVFNYLLKHGLQSHHTFLDVGCGPLRCSKSIINYLSPQKYFGIEGDPNLLKAGLQQLPKELLDKDPSFKTTWDFDFNFSQPSFDFIWVQGVICHMDNPEILKLFNAISNFLNNGSAHISFFPGTIKDPYSGVFQQTMEELSDFAAAANLTITNHGDWGHPRNLKMAILYK